MQLIRATACSWASLLDVSVFFKVKPVTVYPDHETKTGLNAANGLEDEAANQM